jgi:hypothetical protein
MFVEKLGNIWPCFSIQLTLPRQLCNSLGKSTMQNCLGILLMAIGNVSLAYDRTQVPILSSLVLYRSRFSNLFRIRQK